jgi:hypothetical protein
MALALRGQGGLVLRSYTSHPAIQSRCVRAEYDKARATIQLPGKHQCLFRVARQHGPAFRRQNLATRPRTDGSPSTTNHLRAAKARGIALLDPDEFVELMGRVRKKRKADAYRPAT